jgi:MFS transporter, FSR family, fosmidomycin resistance protein
MKGIMVWSNLLVYGISHAVVDCSCAAAVFSLVQTASASNRDLYALILLYNMLAFGGQPLVGRISDYVRTPRLVAVAGCLLVAGAWPVMQFGALPIVTILLAGVGNALFHVGGGTVSLNLTPGRAAAPGIFVAPGALGLFIGGLAAKAGHDMSVVCVTLLLACCVAIRLVRSPAIDYERSSGIQGNARLGIALVLLFFSVSIRSLIGLTVEFPWKTGIDLGVALVLVVVAGKALGGVLADRFGWRRIAVGALLCSAPLIAFGSHVPALSLVGMLLFNITMAVTLVAIAVMLPGRPGFAFGLPCMALLLGALPAFTNMHAPFRYDSVMLAAIFASAGMLFVALGMLSNIRRSPSKRGLELLESDEKSPGLASPEPRDEHLSVRPSSNR